MVIEHINIGDAISGTRLVGHATTIDPVKANNPFNSKKQLKLKKTRARNSECYIDQLLKINPFLAPTIVEKIKQFFKNANKIQQPNNCQIFDDPTHMLIGDTLVAFCDDFSKIERLAEKHGHNWQRVKGIYGSPAICIIDTPCYINRNERLTTK